MGRARIGNTVQEYLNLKSRKVTSGCIEFTGYVSPGGYGREPLNYWFRLYAVGCAHQLAFIVHNGEYDRELKEIAHTCHNKKCVNPEHLRAVSRKENLYMDLNNENNRNMFIPGGIDKLILDTQNGMQYSEVMVKYNISRLRLRTILSHQKYAERLGAQPSWEPLKIKKIDLVKILKLREQGQTLQTIAGEIGCSISMVCRILKGNRRAHDMQIVKDLGENNEKF